MTAKQNTTLNAYHPRNHPLDCAYHVDQYPFECTCGLLGLSVSDTLPDEIISNVRCEIIQDRQSKADSFMEAVCSTSIGFIVSLITWAIIAPLLGIPLIWSQSFIITGIFTAVSVLRSYIIRRMFNGRSIWETIKPTR